MNTKRWVQHVSGTGRKWEVHVESAYDYNVYGDNTHHYLPKSEYVRCDPPERWEDVTEKVEPDAADKDEYADPASDYWAFQVNSPHYRVRKVQLLVSADGQALTPLVRQSAFIVERKVSQ